MKTIPIDEVLARHMTPASIARAKAKAARILEEMELREIREALKISQRGLARSMKIAQPTLSKLEKQPDMQIATLRKVVRALVGDIDIIARFGGDEFGILFPKTDSSQSCVVMNKIYSVFRQSISAKWKVTLSAGVVTYVTPPISLDEMVRAADALMYKAKKEGKDQAEYNLASEST